MSESERLKTRLAELEKQLKSRREQLETQLKAKANSNPSRTGSPYTRPARGGSYHNNSRGNTRGYRGGFRNPPLRRNDLDKPSTIVLNNNKSDDDENSTEFIRENSKGSMTLVNSQVYEDEKKRKLEISNRINEERSRRHKESLKEMLMAHINDNRMTYDSVNRTLIEGVYYAVVQGGTVLAILTLPSDYPDGVKTILIRENKVFQRYSTGDYQISKATPNDSEKGSCKYYSRSGYCRFGDKCKYTHDPQCVALCPTVLTKTKCNNPACCLSHKPSQYNAPACKYFSTGNCTNSNCIYSHRIENPDSPICREFAIGGVCKDGRECPLRHVLICPDQEEYGYCPRGSQCKLKHKSSTLKMNTELQSEAVELIRNEDNDIISTVHLNTTRRLSHDKLDFALLQQGLGEDSDESDDDKIVYTKDVDMEDDSGVVRFSQDSNTAEDPLHKNADYVDV